MMNHGSTPQRAREGLPVPAGAPYEPPAVRSLGAVRGVTQWSPGECAAIGLTFPCDGDLP